MVLDESNVKIVNFMFIMLFISSNGVLCNLTNANWFIKFLSKISPTRFNCEGFLRRVIGNVPDWSCPSSGCGTTHGDPKFHQNVTMISQEYLLKEFGYTWGDEYCIKALVVWFFVWIALCLIGINWKFRKL